jgi:multidrug efflux pump subunit AcrA (membrane-fusion protein)
MIHKHIKSLPHHPKRVILISLIIALIIGTYAYIKINKKVAAPIIEDNSDNPGGGAASLSANLTLGFLSGGRIKSVSVKAGDTVKKGQVLAMIDAQNALGALAQAKAASETAKANYEKIINGATGPAIDVAKAAVRTAEVNLDEITKQQEILVDNADRTLLNSSLQAESVSNDEAFVSPIITGTYSCQAEGSYNLEIYASSGGYALKYSGLEEGTLFLTDVPRPLGDCGLFLSFDKTKTPFSGAKFTLKIPNKSAANYNSNNNAYQLALQTKEQTIASAQAILDQANASLTSLVSTARPEDVAAAQAQKDNAQGAVQIAQAAYENTIITAPSDGTITSVIISPGQIATPNAPAIEFISSSN